MRLFSIVIVYLMVNTQLSNVESPFSHCLTCLSGFFYEGRPVLRGKDCVRKANLIQNFIINIINSRVYFSKVIIDVDRVGQFHSNNLNNKVNESGVRGNTRDCGQTSRSMYYTSVILLLRLKCLTFCL